MAQYTQCGRGHRYETTLAACPFCESPAASRAGRRGLTTRRPGSAKPASGSAASPASLTRVAPPAGAVPEKAASNLAGFLVVVRGDSRGPEYRLFEGVTTIGSEPDCEVVVRDEWVSRRHATVCFRPEEGAVFVLEDAGSRNGTFLNESPVRLTGPIALLDGDEIRVGKTRLRFKALYP